MEENWKEQFKSKLKEEILLLKDSAKEVIETKLENYNAKIRDINVNTFISAYKPDNKHSGAIVTMALYLWEYEARFGFCLNVLSFILVSNGNDLFYNRKENGKRVRIKVTSFEELESFLISRKCKYLSQNGFEMFDEKKNPKIEKFRKVRNNVAHFNLSINNNGLITMYDDQTKNPEDPLILVQEDLMEFSSDIFQILRSYI